MTTSHLDAAVKPRRCFLPALVLKSPARCEARDIGVVFSHDGVLEKLHGQNKAAHKTPGVVVTFAVLLCTVCGHKTARWVL